MDLFKDTNKRGMKMLALTALISGLLILPLATGTAARQPKKVSPEKPIYTGYPLDFSARGHIDRIGDGEIVIDDGLFTVDANVRFNRPNQLGTAMKNFSVGERVGFIVDKKGRLRSVWLLKEKRKKVIID